MQGLINATILVVHVFIYTSHRSHARVPPTQIACLGSISIKFQALDNHDKNWMYPAPYERKPIILIYVLWYEPD